MNKGSILAATLVLVVLATVGWQASSGGGDLSPPVKEAAAQTQQQIRLASPESETRPADRWPGASPRWSATSPTITGVPLS